MAFDLGEALKGVSYQDTGREQIEYIRLDLIDEDPNNFYQLSDIDQLAANIELCGLQQPIRVRPIPDTDRFMIVSGHRRRKAIEMLAKDDPDRWSEVSCIVSRDVVSPALQQLQLIFANSSTRKMSDAEISEQAEQTEKLLYQLKEEEGYEFPGRMRDHVAKVVGASKSKLARLKVIRERLAKCWGPKWKKGTLNESVAYELAQMPEAQQLIIWQARGANGYLDAKYVKIFREKFAKIDALKCKKFPDREFCHNTERKQSFIASDGPYGDFHCDKCCGKCPNLTSCKYVCPAFATKAAQLRADKRAARKQEIAAEREAERPKTEKVGAIWQRFGKERNLSGCTVKAAKKAMGSYYWDDEKTRYEKFESGTASGLKTTRSDMAALSSEFDNNANSIQSLSAKQKLLQSSVAQHQSKVDALTQQYKAAAAAYGENSAMAQKYKQQLNQATVALNKETAALEKNSDAMKEKFLSGLKAVGSGAKNVLSGVGTAAGGVAKGVGAVSAAAAAGVAAIGAGGIVALTTMANMAREAAEAAKTAHEAGETLTASQEQWLAYSGQLDALDASVASAKSALAGVLLPMLGDLSSEGAAFLNDFTRDMEAAAGDTGKQTQVLSDYIVKGAKLIKTKLPEYIAAGKELLSGLGEGLSESGPELLDMGTDLVFDLLDGIIENAPALAEAGIELIQKLTESLISRGPDLLTSAVGMVSQIVTGLAQAAPDLIPAAAQLVTQLITALIQAAPELLLAGLELVYGIISGLINGLGDIIDSADEIINTIVTAFSDNADEFLAVGKNIVTGIWGGITSATEWLYGLLTGWVSNIVDWIKDKLEIQSPSKRMKREVGLQMGRGVGEGWLESMKEVNRMISNSLDMSFDVPEFNFAPRKPGTRAYATAGGKVVNLYFYAKTITESEINMVVDIVNRKLGEDL